MKIDLITIFPGAAIETKKYRLGRQIRNRQALSHFSFLNTEVMTYRYLKRNPTALDTRHKRFINDMHGHIIDAEGNPLEDYTILVERDLEVQHLTAPNTDAQQLISYFCYLSRLDNWISVDHIKIACLRPNGRAIFINNQSEHWGSKYLYMLPVEQTGKAKIRVQRFHGLLIDAFTKLSKTRPNTYKKVMTALALFNESCHISQFNANSSIVLIVSSLEALLSTPRRGKTESFSYALKMMCGFNTSIEAWAKQLYELRSQIAHGEATPGEKLLASKDHHYPHFDIARRMFDNCLLFFLEDIGYLVVDREHKHKIIIEMQNTIISNREKVGKLLKEKKRFTYRAFKRKPEIYREFLLRIESLTPTDYTAHVRIGELLDLLFTISDQWIDEDKKKIAKIAARLPAGNADFLIGQYDRIEILISEIKATQKSRKSRFAFQDKIRALAEAVEKLEGVVHDKDTFDFTLGEFLDRSLRTIWATYY